MLILFHAPPYRREVHVLKCSNIVSHNCTAVTHGSVLGEMKSHSAVTTLLNVNFGQIHARVFHPNLKGGVGGLHANIRLGVAYSAPQIYTIRFADRIIRSPYVRFDSDKSNIRTPVLVTLAANDARISEILNISYQNCQSIQ